MIARKFNVDNDTSEEMRISLSLDSNPERDNFASKEKIYMNNRPSISCSIGVRLKIRDP